MRNKSELDQAYAFCLNMAKSHYENFPVASILLPKTLRHPIAVIYAFARTADDFADEDNIPAEDRLRLLNSYSQYLSEIADQSYVGNDPIFLALQDTVHRFNLPIQLLEDLLIAFRQDVVKSRYTTFNEVLDYCRFSANPVGRLLLHLQGPSTQQQLQQSDAICTSLQLVNFYQDIVQDYTEQNRIYIPQDELAAIGIDEANLIQADTIILAPLLRSLYLRTEQIMSEGLELGSSLSGRLGWEIRAMTLGGLTTLSALIQQPDKALLNRPRLSRRTMIGVILNSAFKTRYKQITDRLLAT
ncbi:MAG: squalene synthase HpnC [Methylophaga nitratireducenticrescens]|uniref:squalene synthase HpnC n=1 Tax=Methylophaga sp. SB9B TaxID=2570356 RepID=UPI0010A7D61A|nr:squalene synthase HpnC [Methylophaga sp. SB9B]THF68695.1 MAG: squalene synthase HpnC [Methylophaga nitratireducenticrescens]THK43403.1 squalene synthase HpnC [Methylophaga sp. SB9B]